MAPNARKVRLLLVLAAAVAVVAAVVVIGGRRGSGGGRPGAGSAAGAADPWASGGGEPGGPDGLRLPAVLAGVGLKARRAGPPVTVTGLVRLAPGGTPVAGAEVAFMNDSGENTAIADDSGRYTIAVASGVGWKVHARTDAAVGYPETFVPTPQAAVRDLEVHPTARVRGRIVDIRGAAVADAVVSLEVEAGVRALLESALPMSATTDGAGRFDLPAVASPLKVKATKGLAQGLGVIATLAPGETAEIEVALLDPIAIRGRVVDADGKPVAGAKILAAVTMGNGGSTEKNRFDSGDDGSFAFAMPAGWLRLEARRGSALSAATAQWVGSGETLADLTLVVADAVGLRGKVITGDGTPVVGAKVRLVANSVYDSSSNSDGSFTVDAIPGQAYLVKIKHSDGQVERQVAAWSGDETFVMRRFGSLRVVTEGADGAKAPDGEVTVTIDSFLPLGDKLARAPVEARFRGGHGAVELTNLEPGVYDLTVATKGAGATRVPRVGVAEGAAQTVRVALALPTVVRGTVKTGTQPVANAQVLIAGKAAFTDARGRFSIPEIGSGRIAIAVVKAGFGNAWVSAVAGADAGPIEIELRPAADGAGQVDGIGVVLAPAVDGVVIASVLPGSPAEGKLSAGDRIDTVDGDDMAGVALDEVVARLRGSAGSSVSISIHRGDDEATVAVVRKRLVVPEGTAVVAIAQVVRAGGWRC